MVKKGRNQRPYFTEPPHRWKRNDGPSYPKRKPQNPPPPRVPATPVKTKLLAVGILIMALVSYAYLWPHP